MTSTKDDDVSGSSSVTGIRYVEIATTDMTRAMEFYHGLGFVAQDSGVSTQPGVRRLSAGKGIVKLIDIGAGGLGGWSLDNLQRGMRHVGLKVGDVDYQARRLRRAGVTFVIEPMDAVGDVRCAFFQDPDGALVEIVSGAVRYEVTWHEELAERERASARNSSREMPPVFDHVAITVADLAMALRLYVDGLGWRPIGQISHPDDPNGFRRTYLQAGLSVLELFSYTVPTIQNSHAPDDSRLGLRAIGVAVADLDAAVRGLTAAGARRLPDDQSGECLFIDLDGAMLRVAAPS